MQESRDRISEEATTKEALRDLKRKISKAIRKDTRGYKGKWIEQTIRNKKIIEVFWRKLMNGKKDICEIRNKDGELTTNRKEILNILEKFYKLLYKSQYEDGDE